MSDVLNVREREVLSHLRAHGTYTPYPNLRAAEIIDRLASRVTALEQERDAAVAKLIPTKDGARVGHGDTVYAHHPMGLGVVSLGVECVAVGGWEWSAPIQATYSTKSAALASKGEVARGE